MALPALDPETRLLKLIDKAEPKLRRALIEAVTAARGTSTLDELADLIERGFFQEAVDAASEAGAIRLGDEVAAVYTAAGADTAKFLGDAIEVTVGFDQVNERAVNVMRNERLRLITNFTNDQRATAQVVMSDGIERGLNPIEQARQFKDSIGLTAGQERAAQNFRKLLEQNSKEALGRAFRDRRFDGTVERAIRDGVPLTQEQIDRMVAGYRRKALKRRAETIARTEALRAVHQGSEEGYEQAIESGKLDPQELVREWHTRLDGRERTSHRALNGEKRGMDEEFKPGLKRPGDPNASASETVNCRCSVSTRIGVPQGDDEG